MRPRPRTRAGGWPSSRSCHLGAARPVRRVHVLERDVLRRSDRRSAVPACPRSRTSAASTRSSACAGTADLTVRLALRPMRVLSSRSASRGRGGMADAHGSGPCGGNPVEVQLLSPAPDRHRRPPSRRPFAYGGRMTRPWVAIDFETANELRSSPCALGLAVVDDGRVIEERSWLIKPPEVRFSWRNTRVHGISAEDVEDAPEFCEIHDELMGYLDGASGPRAQRRFRRRRPVADARRLRSSVAGHALLVHRDDVAPRLAGAAEPQARLRRRALRRAAASPRRGVGRDRVRADRSALRRGARRAHARRRRRPRSDSRGAAVRSGGVPTLRVPASHRRSDCTFRVEASRSRESRKVSMRIYVGNLAYGTNGRGPGAHVRGVRRGAGRRRHQRSRHRPEQGLRLRRHAERRRGAGARSPRSTAPRSTAGPIKVNEAKPQERR